jgi:hypothetical protein
VRRMGEDVRNGIEEHEFARRKTHGGVRVGMMAWKSPI